MVAILVIGGHDPSGAAGLSADLRAIASLGLHAAPVATAITAQNSLRFSHREVCSEITVGAQLDAVSSDLEIAAVKSGMLPCAAGVARIARTLSELSVPYVLDPVLTASTGGDLVDKDAAVAMVRELFPLATMVTPNADEAARLTGRAVVDRESAVAAARLLCDMGPSYVLVKGGHLARDVGSDVLVGRDVTAVLDPLPAAAPARGTGCTLAAFIAARLAGGASALDAVRAARVDLARARAFATTRIGVGPGPVSALYAHRAGALAPRLARLHVLTCATERHSHVELARLAIDGGAGAIQYRNKSPRTTRDMVHDAAAIAAYAGTRSQLIIDDRVDLVPACGAAGVHLGANDLPATHARSLLGPLAVIGRTANDPDEARASASVEVDYLGVGPVFGTRSKIGAAPTLGLERLAAIAAASPVPVIAIGGIEAHQVASVLAAGAYGIAVLSGVACAADPAAATAAYASAIATHLAAGGS